MKKWIIALALLVGAVNAKELERPSIVGTIKNRAGGSIVLTMRFPKDCSDKGMAFAYVRDDGGKISETGCWKAEDTSIYVFWSDGQVFEYDGLNIEFTEEWLKYMKSQGVET
jgi:hypothetical protein